MKMTKWMRDEDKWISTWRAARAEGPQPAAQADNDRTGGQADMAPVRRGSSSVSIQVRFDPSRGVWNIVNVDLPSKTNTSSSSPQPLSWSSSPLPVWSKNKHHNYASHLLLIGFSMEWRPRQQNRVDFNKQTKNRCRLKKIRFTFQWDLIPNHPRLCCNDSTKLAKRASQTQGNQQEWFTQI